MSKEESTERLLARVRDLEKKVEHLRISRRVLMNLLTRIERERFDQVMELAAENRKLRQANGKYAQSLWQKNQQIFQLIIEEQQKENREESGKS